MVFTTSLVRAICKDLITLDTVNEDVQYDWIDVVAIPTRPRSVNRRTLFFGSYADNGGWSLPFDRRPSMLAIAIENGWHVVTDQFPNHESNAQCLYVQSVHDVAQRLYEYVRTLSAPIVIGVTGSVGKTTTIAFLEVMLSGTGAQTVRFYSKRLTPMSVMCHFINSVTEETEFVVMEYSAYHWQHVAELARILPPQIAFISNIYDTHVGKGLFFNRTDILRSKMQIKAPTTQQAYISQGILDQLLIDQAELTDWCVFTVESPHCIPQHMPKTLRTAELYSVAKVVAYQLQIPGSAVDKTLERFIPAEARMVPVHIGSERIFFHGETSGGSRLYSWFETYDNSVPTLFIETVDFADEDPSGFANLLSEVLASEKTLILDTTKNRSRITLPARWTTPEHFTAQLRNATGYIVYHKALAIRNPRFDPEHHLRSVFDGSAPVFD